jgi:hypothetical protein
MELSEYLPVRADSGIAFFEIPVIAGFIEVQITTVQPSE